MQGEEKHGALRLLGHLSSLPTPRIHAGRETRCSETARTPFLTPTPRMHAGRRETRFTETARTPFLNLTPKIHAGRRETRCNEAAKTPFLTHPRISQGEKLVAMRLLEHHSSLPHIKFMQGGEKPGAMNLPGHNSSLPTPKFHARGRETWRSETARSQSSLQTLLRPTEQALVTLLHFKEPLSPIAAADCHP
jgi:hypothetical protein